ncbi:hypothetical protein ACONUD_19445 [Microbulbifer harenosus]|uniref:hypothetical protein n=1 Tax=Microbulbifer harenosus TaxID=2576840 RepID=UPI001484FA4F|nr:hypothetical protein [Microbulbifer harenosus]
MKALCSAAVAAAIATVAGCASAPKAPPVFSESFIANITEQGNRMFTYTATINSGGERGGPDGGMGGGGRGPSGGKGGGPGGGGMGGGPGGGMGGGPGGGGMGGGPGGGMGGGPGGVGGGPGGGGMSSKMRENSEKAAQERLQEVLAKTSYCPHGWFVIEKSNLQGSVEIRGECRAG